GQSQWLPAELLDGTGENTRPQDVGQHLGAQADAQGWAARCEATLEQAQLIGDPGVLGAVVHADGPTEPDQQVGRACVDVAQILVRRLDVANGEPPPPEDALERSTVLERDVADCNRQSCRHDLSRLTGVENTRTAPRVPS